MNSYRLVRILERKNKEGKPYHLAVVLFNYANDCDLLRILITDEQLDKLNDLLKQNKVDINQYVSIEYNSYQKAYQPKINI